MYDPYDGVFLLAFASASASQSFLSIVVIPEGTEDDETQDGWCTLHLSGDQVSGNGKQLADYPSLLRSLSESHGGNGVLLQALGRQSGLGAGPALEHLVLRQVPEGGPVG